MPVHPLADERTHAPLSDLILLGRGEVGPGFADDDIGKSRATEGLELERIDRRGAPVFGPFGRLAEAGDGGGAEVALVEEVVR